MTFQKYVYMVQECRDGELSDLSYKNNDVVFLKMSNNGFQNVLVKLFLLP